MNDNSHVVLASPRPHLPRHRANLLVCDWHVGRLCRLFRTRASVHLRALGQHFVQIVLVDLLHGLLEIVAEALVHLRLEQLALTQSRERIGVALAEQAHGLGAIAQSEHDLGPRQLAVAGHIGGGRVARGRRGRAVRILTHHAAVATVIVRVLARY